MHSVERFAYQGTASEVILKRLKYYAAGLSGDSSPKQATDRPQPLYRDAVAPDPNEGSSGYPLFGAT